MLDLNRRTLLKAGGALALSGLIARSGATLASAQGQAKATVGIVPKAVHFSGDGLSLTPGEYTALLSRLASSEDFERDVYATGGIIAELEQKFAELLGKETAVFLPTGTLANHLALRRLTGDRQRVIVQADSHIYNDSGDCAQKLSGLNLLPIEGAFNPEAIKEALRRTATGRVKTAVGAISLESPLRRGFNTTHSLEQVAGIAELARRKGIGLHLDGARLFMQAAHQGFSPANSRPRSIRSMCPCTRISTPPAGPFWPAPRTPWPIFCTSAGCSAAAPAYVWPLAAVATLFVEDFLEEYSLARNVVDQLLDHLKADSRFRFELIPGGSNGFWLQLDGVDPEAFVENLADRNIHLMAPRPHWDGLLLMVNPTIGRMTAEKLASAFRKAAG